MNMLYILQNQQGYFLQKNNADKNTKHVHQWTDGQDPSKLFRTIHKDEAINMLFESNAQNVELRIHVKEYPANNKGLPLIPKEDLPPPLPKAEASEEMLKETPEGTLEETLEKTTTESI